MWLWAAVTVSAPLSSERPGALSWTVAAGLAVASRLAEASKRVLVLEAGSHQVGNIEVTIPAEAGSPFKTALDWQYFTEPQVNAHSPRIQWTD